MRGLPPHPNIGVLLAYHTHPHPYAVLEYVPGGSLSQCVRAGTLEPAGNACREQS